MSTVITEPSICIPRTLANVTWQDVTIAFEKLIGAGTISRVDLVKDRVQNSKFCRIFVHFRYWPVDNPEIADLRNKLLSGDTIKLVYNNPWFWKCVVSRVPKPERTTPVHEPFIQYTPPPITRSPHLVSSYVDTENHNDTEVMESES